MTEDIPLPIASNTYLMVLLFVVIALAIAGFFFGFQAKQEIDTLKEGLNEIDERVDNFGKQRKED